MTARWASGNHCDEIMLIFLDIYDAHVVKYKCVLFFYTQMVSVLVMVLQRHRTNPMCMCEGEEVKGNGVGQSK